MEDAVRPAQMAFDVLSIGCNVCFRPMNLLSNAIAAEPKQWATLVAQGLGLDIVAVVLEQPVVKLLRGLRV
jgi:hypothetical protein